MAKAFPTGMQICDKHGGSMLPHTPARTKLIKKKKKKFLASQQTEK